MSRADHQESLHWKCEENTLSLSTKCVESVRVYVLFQKNFFLGVVAVRLIWFLRL